MMRIIIVYADDDIPSEFIDTTWGYSDISQKYGKVNLFYKNEKGEYISREIKLEDIEFIRTLPLDMIK